MSFSLTFCPFLRLSFFLIGPERLPGSNFVHPSSWIQQQSFHSTSQVVHLHPTLDADNSAHQSCPQPTWWLLHIRKSKDNSWILNNWYAKIQLYIFTSKHYCGKKFYTWLVKWFVFINKRKLARFWGNPPRYVPMLKSKHILFLMSS